MECHNYLSVDKNFKQNKIKQEKSMTNIFSKVDKVSLSNSPIS